MTLRYLTPLTAEEQLNFGLSDAQPLALADRVRYGELDVLNHVNNKAYMGWFESLRATHFELFCMPHYDGQPKPRTVLRSAEIRFVKEMHLGEDYVATARIAAVRSSSYTIQQELWSGDLRATLTGVMVMMHPDGSGRWPLPETLRKYFIEKEGAAAYVPF